MPLQIKRNARAERTIQYFQKWADVPLMECNNRKSFRKALERAMFAELTEAWEMSPVARHTHNLIPLWKPRKHALTHVSTTAERTLLRCCFAHNDTRTSRHLGTFQHAITCRHCHAANETIDHLFLQCTVLEEARNQLRQAIPLTITNPSRFLRTALLNRRYAIHAQRFTLSALLQKGPSDPLIDTAGDPDNASF